MYSANISRSYTSFKGYEICDLDFMNSAGVLRVTGAPAGLELWRGKERLANGTAGGEYSFRGLPRGQYSLKADGKEWGVLMNGDVAMDLAGKAAPQGDWKRIIGIILILVINIGGITIIVRIWKKGN
jgi:hypothetical protein